MDAHNHGVTYDLCYAITFDYEILKKFSVFFYQIGATPYRQSYYANAQFLYQKNVAYASPISILYSPFRI